MKTAHQIAAEIIEIEKSQSIKDYEMWNGKFYTTKDEQTSIYVNNVKFDFTESYKALPRDKQGFLHVTDFVKMVEELRQPVIDEWYENN